MRAHPLPEPRSNTGGPAPDAGEEQRFITTVVMDPGESTWVLDDPPTGWAEPEEIVAYGAVERKEEARQHGVLGAAGGPLAVPVRIGGLFAAGSVALASTVAARMLAMLALPILGWVVHLLVALVVGLI